VLPDVPTVAESGVPGYDILSWHGVFAPAGTPQEIIARLHKEVARAVHQPDVRQRVESTGNEVVGSTPEEFAARFRADVARFKNVDALAPGQEITAADLEATAKAEGVEIKHGDSVLIRTGYGKFFEADRAKYSGFRPGPGEGAARWLASKRIFLAGDDQMSFEVVPEKGTIFPCHRILIADNGIYIVENLNLEELARALAESKVYEFALILNPPRIRGATGAAANAFAIIPQ